tara:strand:- start:550 stop:873 length:324 start_codon:yes stop_codon:yes gene_type:complete
METPSEYREAIPREYSTTMWMNTRRFRRVQRQDQELKTYYFSQWCIVYTDHMSFLLIQTKEYKDNTYRSGTKVFEYSKEFFQSIWSTFNYLVPIHYGANITVWKNNT